MLPIKHDLQLPDIAHLAEDKEAMAKKLDSQKHTYDKRVNELQELDAGDGVWIKSHLIIR